MKQQKFLIYLLVKLILDIQMIFNKVKFRTIWN